MDDREMVVEALTASRIFSDYALAFREATGVALCLEAIDGAGVDLDKDIAPGVTPVVGGRYRAVIPVRDGAHVIAWMRTGTIYDPETPQPNAAGVPQSRRNPSMSKQQFLPFLKLLTLFAEHLGVVSNQLILNQAHCEPGLVTNAKKYIRAHYRDPLQLEEVARHVNVSTFYLCKTFKRTTGINFSNYIARVRVEAAKDLLNHCNVRISEIALEVGFQSLTHFNRVFKRFTGESPRAYRRHLPRCDRISSAKRNNETKFGQAGPTWRQFLRSW